MSNVAAEHYHRLYYAVHGVRTVCLRLTNTYGPRQMMKDEQGRYAFIYYWIRRIVDGEPLQIMGGHQVRDFTYVDDCVDALLLAAAESQADGEVYNLGGEAISLVSLADLLIEVARGAGRARSSPCPPERRAIDPGKVYLSYEKVRRELGWEPKVGLADGPGPDGRLLPPAPGALLGRRGGRRRSRWTPCTWGGRPGRGRERRARSAPIPFNLTRPQYLELREEIDAAVQEVLDDSWFILGKQGTAFEQEFAAYLGAGHAVGVGSGTAAIHLALWALGVGRRATRC